MNRPYIWDLTPCDYEAASTLAGALGIPLVVARLLCHRGLGDPDAAEHT